MLNGSLSPNSAKTGLSAVGPKVADHLIDEQFLALNIRIEPTCD